MSGNDSHASVDQLATGTLDEHDKQMLRELAAAYAVADPVPAGLIERLQFAITLDALEAEVAQLQRADTHLVGARADGVTEVQTVTFTSPSLTTMITVTPAGVDRVRIDGWAAPGAGLSVELRIVDAQRQTTADADGRFVFDDVPRGLAQFLLRAPDSERPPVITPSMQI